MIGTRDEFHVGGGYRELVREVGLDAEAVWEREDIKVWRSVTERENATLDAVRGDGSGVRLHIKRYRPAGKGDPSEAEVAGIRLLADAGIPTVPLVAWGKRSDGRSFVITEDLKGYQAADKVLGRIEFGRLVGPIADVAKRVHEAGLHHRDFYLCHFFVNDSLDVRVIDAARVKRLPGWPWRRRWVVKDLGQLWYSMMQAGVSREMRVQLLERYGWAEGVRSVEGKARRIERHDKKLVAKQPGRNISIPSGE